MHHKSEGGSRGIRHGLMSSVTEADHGRKSLVELSISGQGHGSSATKLGHGSFGKEE